MKRVILSVMLLFAVCAFSQAQDHQAKLLKDMVTVENTKMVTNDYTLLTLSDGKTVQIKSHAESPAQGVISRDNFIAFFTMFSTNIIDGLKGEDDKATTKDLEEIIGNADVEINLFMAKGGIQVEVKSSEGTNRNTVSWADLFKD